MFKKPIILIWDKDKTEFPKADFLREDMREVLAIRAIIWNSSPGFINVCLQQLYEKIRPVPVDRLGTSLP